MGRTPVARDNRPRGLLFLESAPGGGLPARGACPVPTTRRPDLGRGFRSRSAASLPLRVRGVSLFDHHAVLFCCGCLDFPLQGPAGLSLCADPYLRPAISKLLRWRGNSSRSLAALIGAVGAPSPPTAPAFARVGVPIGGVPLKARYGASLNRSSVAPSTRHLPRRALGSSCPHHRQGPRLQLRPW